MESNVRGIRYLNFNYLALSFAALAVFSNPSFAGKKYDQLKTKTERAEYLEKKIQKLLKTIPIQALCHDENQFVLDRRVHALFSIYNQIMDHADAALQQKLEDKMDQYSSLVRQVAAEREELDKKKRRSLKTQALSSEEAQFLTDATELPTYQFYSQLYDQLSQREKERMKTPPVLGLGEKFTEVEPDSDAGSEYLYEPLIKTAHGSSLSNEKTPYDIFFERASSLSVGFLDQGKTALIRRVSGYTFTGNKKSPDNVKAQGGFLGYAFDPTISTDLTPEKLHPGHYFKNGQDEAFRSSTTSPEVARYFATKTEKEGYVYVVLANRGLDANDTQHVKNRNQHELEVAIPGSIPWGEVVGYRKVIRDSNKEPHFTGPIFLRDGLKEKDPKAYEKIRRGMSLGVMAGD